MSTTEGEHKVKLEDFNKIYDAFANKESSLYKFIYDEILDEKDHLDLFRYMIDTIKVRIDGFKNYINFIKIRAFDKYTFEIFKTEKSWTQDNFTKMKKHLYETNQKEKLLHILNIGYNL